MQDEINNQPSIGSHLEVTWGNKSMWHECVVLPKNKIAIDRHAGWHVIAWQNDFEFRPIKSDREKAIEAAMEVALSQAYFGETLSICERFSNGLYDAGLLRLPEDK
jgi:hypothetical protein